MCCRRRLGPKISKSGTGALLFVSTCGLVGTRQFAFRFLQVIGELIVAVGSAHALTRIRYVDRRQALITPIFDALGRHRHLLSCRSHRGSRTTSTFYCGWFATHTFVLTCSHCCHHGSFRHITRRSSTGRVHYEHSSRLEARARAVSAQALC